MKLFGVQVEAYSRNGYLFPPDVFDAKQVETIRGNFEQAQRDAQRLGLEDNQRLALAAGATQDLHAAY